MGNQVKIQIILYNICLLSVGIFSIWFKSYLTLSICISAFLIGFYNIFFGLYYKVDNHFLVGIFLLSLSPICILLFYFPFDKVFSFLLFALFLAFLATGLYFKDIKLKKFSLLLFIIFVLCLLFNIGLFNLGVLLLLLAIACLFYFIGWCINV